MEAVFAITLGVLTASGVYLLLRARIFPVVMGLTLISYAVNLFIFSTGRLGTGVPAVIGAKMIIEGHWREPGVWNVEQRDPDPFMADMNSYGLPWTVIELDPSFRLDVVKGQDL